MIKRLLLFVLLGGLGFSSAQAQIYDFAISGGISGYVGDIQPAVSLTNFQPGGSLWFKYNWNPHWGFRVGLMRTTIGADDANASSLWQQQRNLSFETYIRELSFTAEFNFLPYITGHHKYNHTPFIFAGIARFKFNPTAEINGTRHNLQPLGTEGQGLDQFPTRQRYNLTSYSIPMGLGYRWNFYKFHSLQVEAGLRYAFTDYIDDVSLTYVENDLMITERGELAASLADRSPEVGQPLREPNKQRGINTYNDTYWYLGVSYIFTINSGRCPRFR